MSFNLSRRCVLMGMTAISLAALPALPALAAPFTEDTIVGDENAPVTVIEYISYTCPACAGFHNNVWPDIKKAYVDTGKVKFIFRGFYRNTVDLDVGVVARCGGEKGYYPLTHAYLSTQPIWTRAPDVTHAIKQIAKRAGMPGAKLDACLADMEFKTKLVENFRDHAAEHGVNATPSFVIDGKTHSGGMSFEDFSDLVDGLLS